MKESDFKNWDKFFDQHYKRFVLGTTHKTHIFSTNKDNKTTLLLRADDFPETIQSSQALLKKGQALTPERLALLKSPQLESIVAPGIPPIKQVELFSKYRGLHLVQFQDITCPDPHENRRYCFIADYSQNMELPYFGASQPGDIYYFSALKINVFGIVDCSFFGGKLSAHVIIMDNCTGQNKNRMVLRLANYLVEADFFETVNFIFYIVGHTKNACDRWFNTLKKNYRCRNIYSFHQMIYSVKTNSKINITVTKESDFKNWEIFLTNITNASFREQPTRPIYFPPIKTTRPHFFFALMTFLKPFNHPNIYSKKDKH
jgi:hypothetical protein